MVDTPPDVAPTGPPGAGEQVLTPETPATASPAAPPADGDVDGDVDVLLLRLDPELPAPAYAHPGDAGADLVARHDIVLGPGERGTVATGVALALPQGYAAFVHPRSGLAARHGVTVLNGPGTVDAGYRGEVVVALVNTDQHRAVTLHRGDRVAQLVVQRVSTARFVDVDELPESVRGAGGYGSTGGLTPSGTEGATLTVAGGRDEQDDVEEDS